MKILRILILVSIALFSIYIGYVASQYVGELMGIQKNIYDQYATVINKVGDTRDSIMGFFGQEEIKTEDGIEASMKDLEKKIRIVSGCVRGIVSLFVWNIIFGLVYSFRKRYNRIREFLN